MRRTQGFGVYEIAIGMLTTMSMGTKLFVIARAYFSCKQSLLTVTCRITATEFIFMATTTHSVVEAGPGKWMWFAQPPYVPCLIAKSITTSPEKSMTECDGHSLVGRYSYFSSSQSSFHPSHRTCCTVSERDVGRNY